MWSDENQLPHARTLVSDQLKPPPLHANQKLMCKLPTFLNTMSPPFTGMNDDVGTCDKQSVRIGEAKHVTRHHGNVLAFSQRLRLFALNVHSLLLRRLCVRERLLWRLCVREIVTVTSRERDCSGDFV